MRVLQLTDEQINALPPQTRDQVRQLVRSLLTHFLWFLTNKLHIKIENSINNAIIITPLTHKNEYNNNKKEKLNVLFHSFFYLFVEGLLS